MASVENQPPLAPIDARSLELSGYRQHRSLSPLQLADRVEAPLAPQGDRIGARAQAWGGARGVPADFGAQDGTPIANKSTILKDLWRSLGHDEPPSLMYIFVKPARSRFPLLKMLSPDSTTSTNPYGHAVIAYRVGDELRVVNMTAKDPMVNFMPAEEYFFGNDFENGAAQGGIYNRAMVAVASWDTPPEKIEKLDAYYRKLAQQRADGDAHFSLAFPVVKNVLDFFTNIGSFGLTNDDTYGNCSLHTSRGMEEAGIIEQRTMWPKKVAYDFIEESGGRENVAIIDMPVIGHAHQTIGVKQTVPGWTRLGLPYAGEPDELSEMATVRVEVPTGGTRARVVSLPTP